MEKTKKKLFKMPTAFTVLISLIIIIGIVTWIVPGVNSAKVSDILMAPVNGFKNAIDISIFVLVLGGFLGVVNETGALDTGIKAVVKKLHGKEIIMIPILMFLISLGGTTFGMAEETIAFYAMVTATMVAAGFDPLVAAATIMLGSTAGVLGATVDPFVVSVSTDALSKANIEVNQTIIMIVGSISWLTSYAIAATFVMRYAKKVKDNKEASLLTNEEWQAVEKEYGNMDVKGKEVQFNNRQKLVMTLFAITFIVMILGVIPWDNFGITIFGHTGFLTGNTLGSWWFSDLTTWFLISAIVIGLVYGLAEKAIVSSFIKGAGDLLSVALIIAVSRGISVIMQSSGLDVKILDSVSGALAGTPTILYTALCYIIYILLAFLIPSSSGMATVTMPIIGPLTQSLGLTPEVAISVLSGAVALVNLVTPTSAVMMGGISISRIEYPTWLKFVGKIFLTLILVHIVILSIAMVVFK